MKLRLLTAAATVALFTNVPAIAQDAQAPEGVCPPGQECPTGGAGAAQQPPAAAPDGQALDPGAAPTDGQAAQQPPAEEQPAQDQAQGQDQQPGEEPTDQAQGQDQQQPGEEPTTTGSTNAQADITEEQQTEIRAAITEVSVEPERSVDFNITIGAAIPNTIVLHPLPPRIVEVVPVYADYQFFMLADGTIIIVDPATFHVVYVLHA